MSGTARSLAYLLGTDFIDGQPPQSINPQKIRDLSVSVYPTLYNNVMLSPGLAVGDGVTNDTASFNTATAALSAAGGGVLIVPVKAFLLDPITIPSNVVLAGAVPGPFISNGNPKTTVAAPTLLVNSHASAFITLFSGSGIQDVLIFDPNQVANSAATPTTYPPMITFPYNSGGGAFVRRNTLVNAFAGINIGTGQTWVYENRIGAYSYAINIDGCLDWVFVRENLIEPFYDTYAGQTWPQTIDTWVMNNGWGMTIRRVDNVFASSNGIFGKYGGYLFDDTQVGATPYTAGYGTILNATTDNVAYGFYAKSTNSLGNGFQIINPSMTGNPSGIGTSGVATFATVTGGTETPTLTINGGFQNGTWSATNTLSIATGTVIVRNVAGINPLGLITAPTVPASGTPLQNTYHVEMRVFVSGGTVTAVGINGTPTGLISGSFLLEPGDFIVVVYSVAPTWTWFGK
jgi:hypothetical protein